MLGWGHTDECSWREGRWKLAGPWLTDWGLFQGPGEAAGARLGDGKPARLPPALVTSIQSHQTRIKCFSVCQAFPKNCFILVPTCPLAGEDSYPAYR